jgi:hypothetical protein
MQPYLNVMLQWPMNCEAIAPLDIQELVAGIES